MIVVEISFWLLLLRHRCLQFDCSVVWSSPRICCFRWFCCFFDPSLSSCSFDSSCDFDSVAPSILRSSGSLCCNAPGCFSLRLIDTPQSDAVDTRHHYNNTSPLETQWGDWFHDECGSPHSTATSSKRTVADLKLGRQIWVFFGLARRHLRFFLVFGHSRHIALNFSTVFRNAIDWWAMMTTMMMSMD